MTNIEYVIKIPEETYKATCNGSMLPPDVDNVVNAIKNATTFPKGHDITIRAEERKAIFDELYNKLLNDDEEAIIEWCQDNLIDDVDDYIEKGGTE